MKRFKLKNLLATILTIFFFSSFFPNAYAASEDQFAEATYNSLITQSKEDFWNTLVSICSSAESPSLIPAAVAFSDRSDFSQQEMIRIITDSNAPYLLRQIAIERYANNNYPVNDEIYQLISDDTIPSTLRTLLVSLLSEHMNSSAVPILLSIVDDADDNLSYNAIKALEKVNPDEALHLATNIYKNYLNESPARINIASKVLARAISTDEPDLYFSKKDYLNLSQEIVTQSKSDEVTQTVIQSMSKIDSAIALSFDRTANVTFSSRASGRQGYAAYRDGVAGNLNWHGAIIYGTGITTSSYIFAQATGSGHTTETVNYSTFLNAKNPQGYYRPKSTSLTSSQRDSVVATARALVNERISYTLTNPISYSMISTTNKYQPSDILGIRCDGFVEYCYEYNNIKVFGSDSYWNISLTDSRCQDEHGGFLLTPKSQAQNYMTRIGAL